MQHAEEPEQQFLGGPQLESGRDSRWRTALTIGGHYVYVMADRAWSSSSIDRSVQLAAVVPLVDGVHLRSAFCLSPIATG
jgi:hypothetical protein